MAGKANTTGTSRAAPSREDRLKTALKANIARRKAQAAARSPHDGGADDIDGGGPKRNNTGPKG